mmetsp:Transcript_37169/g.92905  ORF Transcript_37169/g.92905 Transcript_37169/m.92905 type:complete len:218 (-) Transcript_37169:41-694(-)
MRQAEHASHTSQGAATNLRLHISCLRANPPVSIQAMRRAATGGSLGLSVSRATRGARQLLVRSRVAEHLVRRRAPRGRVGEGVGEHLGGGERHAAVEAGVQLLPLAPVDVEEGLRRHRAVEVLGARAHLLGRVLAAGLIVRDEVGADGDVLRPLAVLHEARLHLGPPQHVAERVGAQEALGEDVGVELGVLEHARAEEGVERRLVDLGVGEVHEVLV